MTPRLPEIDRFLRSLDAARDDDELRRLFGTYQTSYETDLPEDPDSPAYRDRQFALYEHLFGKPYSTQHEKTPFDVAAIAQTPFPYSTGSWTTVGNQLIAIGFLIKAMALPKGARILEFGPGWGNTTVALGRMGYDVTAIDIEPNFVELIRERARRESGGKLSVDLGDFLAIETVEQPFDAILFFECFHHCANHQRLIAGFDKALTPNGLICFAGEPITPDFPIPWGLRMDGESLWAIRKNGWLELGFNLEYFERTMRRHGWRLTHQVNHDSPWASVMIARRTTTAIASWLFRDGELRSIAGVIDGDGDCGGVSTDGRAGYLLHGPYASVAKGRYRMQVSIDSSHPSTGSLEMDVVSNAGQTVHAVRQIELAAASMAAAATPDAKSAAAGSPGAAALAGAAAPGVLELAFSLDKPVSDLEVRIRSDAETRLRITGARLVEDVDTAEQEKLKAHSANLHGHRWQRRLVNRLARVASRSPRLSALRAALRDSAAISRAPQAISHAPPAPASPSTAAQSPFFHYAAAFDPVEIMYRHAVTGLQPMPGYLTNFLGVRIDPKFFPNILDAIAGNVEAIPIPANWHADIAEWGTALRAVELSRETFTMIELGCRWGCWMNNTGAAARRMGRRVHLIGVKGDEGHCAFARESMSTNGFSAAEYTLHRGVAAANSGVALFPRQHTPGVEWGGEAVFGADAKQRADARASGSHDELPMIALSDLARTHERIDLLHIDIQGGEADLIDASLELLERKVSYLLIGTHSKPIEGHLYETLLKAGWRIEMERGAIFSLQGALPIVVVDGVQGWRNPRLLPE